MTVDSGRTREHIPVLDGMRGVAALLVLWGHLKLQVAIPSLQASGFGVQLFFALSGFLITRILLYNKANNLGLLSFYKRRALRIFPAYYLMLLFVFICFRNHGGLLYAATYTYNFSGVDNFPIDHTWSLCVEEHYYLLWPLIVMLLPAAFSRRVALALCVASFGAFVVYQVYLVVNEGRFVPAKVTTWTPFRIVSLLGGSMLAYGESRVINRRAGLILGLSLMAASLVLCEGIIYFGHVFHIGLTTPAEILRGDLFAIGVLAFLLSRQVPQITALFEMNALRRVGRISYGLYLYHMPIFMLLDLWRPRTGLSTLLCSLGVALSFLAATVSYRWYERPILDGRGPWQRAANSPREIPAP